MVLAGGESKRFGSEKSLFPVAGRPMAEWALNSLKRRTAEQVVVAPEQKVAEALGIPGRPDRIPGLGPLGGLHTALCWAEERGHEGVFLLACDLPLVTGALIGGIIRGWPQGVSAVLPGSPGPLGFEPLCAGYGTSALPVLEKLIREGRRSMESVLSHLDAHRIPGRDLGSEEELALAFTNVNDLETARRAEVVLRGQNNTGEEERAP